MQRCAFAAAHLWFVEPEHEALGIYRLERGRWSSSESTRVTKRSGRSRSTPSNSTSAVVNATQLGHA
jgi:hypothetical protein